MSNRKAVKPIASETDIAEAKPLDNLRFGGGLYLWVTPKGVKYYQVRLSVGGKGTTRRLGKSPGMTLAQAQREAESYRADVAQARQEIRKSAFKMEQVKRKSENKGGGEKYPCFLSMDDAGQFIRDLFSTPLLSDDIRLAIWLQLLIPSRPSELLCARWDEFDINHARWTINRPVSLKPKRRTFAFPELEYLSRAALCAIEELRELTGMHGFLFPSFASLEKGERDKKIARAKQNCGLPYPYELNGFRNFFRTIATKSSYFRAEFIEEIIAQKAGKGTAYGNDSYTPQRRALAEWWGNELVIKRQQFSKSYQTSSGI